MIYSSEASLSINLVKKNTFFHPSDVRKAARFLFAAEGQIIAPSVSAWN